MLTTHESEGKFVAPVADTAAFRKGYPRRARGVQGD